MKTVAAIVLVAFVAIAESKILNRCQIARELLNHGFNRGDLDNWVCLVESESSGNTRVVGPPNSDGSHDYGLFQINDRYWCGHGRNGGDCHIDCNNLINDDISDDSVCVRKIFSIHGWGGWYGWVRKCQGKPIPNIGRECGF